MLKQSISASSEAAYDKTKQFYRADIDGLRAIAVTSVVLAHAGFSCFQGGFLGVDIFFVISGYLINGIILRANETGTFQYVQFYSRRARRILPALICVVTASCIAGWFLLSASEYFELAATARSALLGLSNFSFWHWINYFRPDASLAPMLMTWSLGVEEQFYLIVPALMLVLSRGVTQRGFLIFALVAVSSLTFSYWCSYRFPETAFYLLPSRAWELAIGGLIAAAELIWAKSTKPLLQHALIREATGWAGLAAIGASVFSLTAAHPLTEITLLPVLGTAALISAKGSLANRMLGAGPIRFVGLISYSWYLWHWPILAFLRIVAVGTPPTSARVVAVILSFVLAVLTWQFIEKPFRRVRLKPRPVLLCYAAVLAVAIMLPWSIKREVGFPFRLPPATNEVENFVVKSGLQCLVDFGEETPDPSPLCREEEKGRPTIALLGDSHAAALGRGVRAYTKSRQLGIEIFAKAACLPLTDVAARLERRPTLAHECAVFVRKSLDLITGDPSISTVVIAGQWSWPSLSDFVVTSPNLHVAPNELFDSGLRKTVERIEAAGKTAIVVGDVPNFDFDVARYALTRSIPLRARLAASIGGPGQPDFPDIVSEDTVDPPRDVQAAAKAGHGIYVDLYDSFCSQRGCEIAKNGLPLFIDSDHLSHSGSIIAVKKLFHVTRGL